MCQSSQYSRCNPMSQNILRLRYIQKYPSTRMSRPCQIAQMLRYSPTFRWLQRSLYTPMYQNIQKCRYRRMLR